MLLELHRDTMLDTATMGTIAIDGKIQCHTLEDVDRHLESGGKKLYGNTAIPRGTYEIIVDYSQRFKRLLPRLLLVSNFEGVRIHPGNTADDTEGCILVGMRRRGNMILDSRKAFEPLHDRIRDELQQGNKVFIRIT